MPIDATSTSASASPSPFLGGAEPDIKPTTQPGISRPSYQPITPCCTCGLGSCSVDLPAFAYLTDDTDRRKNDYTDFVFPVKSSQTMTATLQKLDNENNVTNSYTITDNTYGLFFSTGTIKTDYWAFMLDWYKVANRIGYGRYRMNFVIENSLSISIYEENSNTFYLQPYSCSSAHRTVKVISYQTGYFENGLDYTNLDYTFLGLPRTFWQQELRVYGWFYRSGRLLEEDNIVIRGRGRQTIQSQSIKKYNLKIDHAETTYSNKLFDEMLRSGEVYISDYNSNNIEVYDMVRVRPTQYNDPIVNTLTTSEFYEIELQEWKENNVLRFK